QKYYNLILNTIIADNVVFSYMTSDSVFVQNIHTGKSKGYLLRSNYHRPSSELNFDYSFEELNKFMAENTRYFNLTYSALKKKYYRVAFIAHDYYTSQGHINSDGKWSLLVADENFNIEREYIFDT